MRPRTLRRTKRVPPTALGLQRGWGASHHGTDRSIAGGSPDMPNSDRVGHRLASDGVELDGSRAPGRGTGLLDRNSDSIRARQTAVDTDSAGGWGAIAANALSSGLRGTGRLLQLPNGVVGLPGYIFQRGAHTILKWESLRRVFLPLAGSSSSSRGVRNGFSAACRDAAFIPCTARPRCRVAWCSAGSRLRWLRCRTRISNPAFYPSRTGSDAACDPH